MVLRYLMVAALASGITYGTLRPNEQVSAQHDMHESCSYTDHEGNDLPLTHGPIGPRIGEVEYLAANLTHEEKVRLITSSGFDGVGMLERMAVDLYENRGRVIDDIYRSIEQAIRGGS